MTRSGARRQSGSHDHTVCIRDALSAASELCVRRGARLTPIRRRVLELVWRGHAPVGAYEILAALNQEGRGAAPPTVYRALDFLLANRLIHRLESRNAYIGCGAPAADHSGQFLICRKCDAVVELADVEIADRLADRAAGLGFAVEGQTVELSGLCRDCHRPGP